MLDNTRPHWRRSARSLLAAALWVLAFAPSCDDLGAPPENQVPGDIPGNYDGTVLVFGVESPSGGPTPLRLLAANLSYDPMTQRLRAEVSIHNSGGETLRGPDAVAVGGFVPASVAPYDTPCWLIQCPPPPVVCFDCFFPHAGTYGDDGLLSPGETSAPVEWVFSDPDGESFGFHARFVGLDPIPANGRISGHVFVDQNANGRRDPSEPGIPGQAITLSHANSTQRATTDENGFFGFDVGDTGFYEVERDANDRCRPTTLQTLQVIILRRPDGSLSGFDRADFGCRGDAPPDSLDLRIVGTVFRDTNANGVRDDGEPGIADIGVSASGPCLTPVSAYTRTDMRGNYVLLGRDVHCVLPWTVSREPIEGSLDTTPNPVILPGPPPDGSRLFRVDFGVTDQIADAVFIEGVVFWDSDRDGVRDSNETGIARARLDLQSYCRILRFTHTDRSGHYRFVASATSCAPTGVRLSEPGSIPMTTTPNPYPIDQALLVPGSTLGIDFGVPPVRNTPR